MKWIRRLLLSLLVVLVVALIAVAVGYQKMHGLPEWYARHVLDPAAQAAAANRANQKLAETLTETARMQNAMRHPEAASINAARGVPAIAHPLDLTLTDEEANAFFDSWDQRFHWSEQYSRFLRDPQIIFHDHHIILAATSVELETLISVEFAPEVKDDMLRLPVVSILAGNLPLPRAFWDRYRSKWVAAVQRQLPATSREAKLNIDGSASTGMVDAVLGRLLIQILNDQPADPILFLPYEQSMKTHYLPVKLTKVKIDGNSMQLNFLPLSDEQRQALVTSIRHPIQMPADTDPPPHARGDF